MKRILPGIIAVALLLSNCYCVLAEKDEERFPYNNYYPEGIEGLKSFFVTDEVRDKNIGGGFEEQNEINIIEDNSFGDQRKIVEESYSGKFGLQIEQKEEGILPILETEYFSVGRSYKELEEGAKYEDGGNNISIVVNGKKVTVEGIAEANTEVALLVKQGDEIKYIDQKTSDSSGTFIFYFEMMQYGEYTLAVGRSNEEVYRTQILCKADEISEVELKTNLVLMKVKPMYKAKQISFYTKAKIINAEGVLEERYVPIKSDRNSDGIFEVGDDLSLGKWQEIEIVLDDIDEELAEGMVSGIYMKANIESVWIFDDLKSDYRKINSTKIDLSQFEKANVVYGNSGLKFATTPDGKYNTESKIVSSSIDIGQDIFGISIKSSVEHIDQVEMEETGESALLLDADLTSESWKIYSDYESEEQVSNPGQDSNILINYGGKAEFDAGAFSTEERVKVSIDLRYIDGNPNDAQVLQLELCKSGSETPYYTARQNMLGSRLVNSMSYILPKIQQNTVFKIKYLKSGESKTIELSAFKIYLLEEKDWNAELSYKGNKRINIATFSDTPVTDLPAYENNEYALKNENIKGKVFTQYQSLQLVYENYSNSIFAIRIVNLSNESKEIFLGNTKYTVGFGENVIMASAYHNLSAYADENVLLVSICEYSRTKENEMGQLHYKNIDGLVDSYILSKNGNKIYYSNYIDYYSLHSYNIITGEKQKIIDGIISPVCISNDERYLVYSSQNKYYLYDQTNAATTELPAGTDFSFNGKGELYFIYNYAVCKYENGALSEKITGLAKSAKYTFDNSGNYILVYYQPNTSGTIKGIYNLYKSINGSFTLIDSLESSSYYPQVYLSDDLSTIYVQSNGNAVDIKTGVSKGNIGEILYKASDNTYVVSGLNIYNPATEEKYKIVYANGKVHYNPDTSMLTIINHGTVARYKVVAEKSNAKYLLSFDGKNTWQSYKNGRWTTVCSGVEPTHEEMDAHGMTSDEVNNIDSVAFKKLYSNNTEVLSVDFAIFMNSNTNELTPVINDITVETVDDIEKRDLYRIGAQKFTKSDYSNITSIFPVEDFIDATECYYILYLGNDWLYTYKDGEIIKMAEKADELFSDIKNTWIKFKQYAMSAKELRNIPKDILTGLLVNEDYANTEFGIIYVMKSENDNKGTVTFKVQADAKFITKDNIVVEIMMNGNDRKVIDSKNFSKAEIEDFLSWLQNRQAGRGDIFYNFNNGQVQHFINYYMINSINVYDRNEYINKTSGAASE